MSSDQSSLKNWWTRRLCIKRIIRRHRKPKKKRYHQHHQQQLPQNQCLKIHFVCKATPATGNRLCNHNRQDAITDSNTSPTETKPTLPSLPARRCLPPTPAPVPQLPAPVCTPFSPVLPRVSSRLQTITEEATNDVGSCDVNPQINRDKFGTRCEGGRKEASAANSFADCCSSDDLDSRVIVESDTESGGINEARNSAIRDAILDESIVKEQCEAEASEFFVETATAVIDVYKVHPPQTKTETSRSTIVTPPTSPSIHQVHSLPWLCRYRRILRQERRPSAGATYSRSRSEKTRLLPEVRLKMLSVRSLSLALLKFRDRCFETRENSYREKPYDEDKTSVTSMQLTADSKLDVGVAYRLQTSDFDSSASSRISTLSLKDTEATETTETTPSSTICESTVVRSSVESELICITQIWFEESSDSIRMIENTHRDTHSAPSTETSSSNGSAVLSRKSSSRTAFDNEVAVKGSKFLNVPTVTHNKTSREKKLKVKRDKSDDGPWAIPYKAVRQGHKPHNIGEETTEIKKIDGARGNPQAEDKTNENKRLRSDAAFNTCGNFDGRPDQGVPAWSSALCRCCDCYCGCCDCYCGCCSCNYCGLKACSYQDAFAAADTTAGRVPRHNRNLNLDFFERRINSNPHRSAGFHHQHHHDHQDQYNHHDHHQHHYHHQHPQRCEPMRCFISDGVAVQKPADYQPPKRYINPHSHRLRNQDSERRCWQAQQRQMIAQDHKIAKAVSPMSDEVDQDSSTASARLKNENSRERRPAAPQELVFRAPAKKSQKPPDKRQPLGKSSIGSSSAIRRHRRYRLRTHIEPFSRLLADRS